MQRRPINWVALVAVGLAGVVAMSTATSLGARSAASPFELVATDRWEGACPDCMDPGAHTGTFTSGGRFCESGAIDDLGGGPRELLRRYTCTDGSGSLTLKEAWGYAGADGWSIVESSGRYAGLRGRGRSSGELVSESTPFVWRTTLQGVVDADAVAPSVAFASATATKLRRPAGEYALRLTLSLRDDVEGSAVGYKLKVIEGPEHPRDRLLFDLAYEEGSTASGSVSTTLSVYPASKRVRAVRLLLSASDPVGNEVTVARWLKLPRR